ncbi:flagellar motor protein MotB [Candidatus Paracaedibacter symbiosus]|uniref:flagellar motor protein MotB n=1 Tax=Candidatus Paracaedibacter symbiosus TaxID=244582 RepID=UPI000509490F|nr:flagellar motor protein MotB [Candidatus Paracaedibacter symbiosus]
MSDEKKQPIIIKKIRKAAHHAHHGGSWKIAYADFVTAMMAFFLLMWLINATSEEQKRGIANFFDPISAGTSVGGNVGVMAGLSIKEKDGTMEESSSRIAIKPAPPTEKGHGGQAAGDSKSQEEDASKYAGMTEEEKQKIQAQKDIESKLINTRTFKNKAEEERAFKEVSNQVKQAMESAPELKELRDNISIEETKEGLKINIIDQNHQSMFPSGSSRMYKQMHEILVQVARAIKDIPNKIDISGHTDSVPYTNNSLFSNWELSAERANATRRVLAETGVADSRFDSVVGRADKDPFNGNDPKDASNRRISITLMREIPI